MIKSAKVIKAPAAAVPLVPVAVPSDRGRVLRKELVEASERADRVVAAAEQRAQQLMRDAELAVAALRRTAVDEGRARGYAEGLARLAAVARLEAEADQRALERSVEVARILAERLIGSSLSTDPNTVAGLALQVLSEVRGARQIELHVHPADVAALRAHLDGALAGLVLVGDVACARGDFRAVTDVGTVEAKLADRLDLLATKLTEAIGKGT